MDKEQAMSSVYHRPGLVHSGVPTPIAVPDTGEKKEEDGNHYGARCWANQFQFICLFNLNNNPAA